MDKECSCCGAKGSTHAHHILPKALGGDDRPTNLVDVCPDCHWKIHGRKTRGADWRNLQAEGIAKAKAEGKYKGRPANKGLHAEIKKLHSEGWTPSRISKRLNCGVATVYRNRD